MITQSKLPNNGTLRVLSVVSGSLVSSFFGWGTSPAFAQDAAPAVAQPTRKFSIFNALDSGDEAQVAQILKDDPSQANAINSSGERALVRAARSGRENIVRLLLEAKADPNIADVYQQPVLSIALDSSNVALLNLLADYGANLNSFDTTGKTPLVRSAYSWSREISEALINKGAKLDALDQRGMLPLVAAALGGSEKTFSLYLEKSPSVSGRSISGSTPLHAALWRGNSEYVKLLLQKKANPNASTCDGDTPLHIAALELRNEVSALLAAGADANRRDAQGDLPLHLALRSLNTETAEETRQSLYPLEFKDYTPAASPTLSDEAAARTLAPLIAKSDINVRDRFGVSPLLIAILARQTQVRNLILARQPRMDATTQFFNAIAGSDNETVSRLLAEKPFLVYFRLPDGTTPLHVAALWGARGSAELLLQKGADVNARDARGITPLRLCVGRAPGEYAKRNEVMVRLLLDRKAEVDARDKSGATPLMSAARAGNYDAMAQLLEAKADINLRDAHGQTALHLLSQAPTKMDGAVAQEILARGAERNLYDEKGDAALSLAVKTRHLELVKALLDNGFDPNLRDFNGQTPLTTLTDAFWGESADVEPFVAALLDKGANPNLGVLYGEAVLTRAVQSRNINVATLLLDHGADPNGIPGAVGYTPLLTALHNGNKEMLVLLLEHGADPLHPSTNGEVPLQTAQQVGNKEFIDLLQAKVEAQRTK